MARKRNQGNGQPDESLKAMQQALAQMLQAQANLAQNQVAFLGRIAESDAETARIRREAEETKRLNAQTFARIEERFARIEAILADLPEAVHRRFGFQPPRPPTE
jgi:hypothetical protein